MRGGRSTQLESPDVGTIQGKIGAAREKCWIESSPASLLEASFPGSLQVGPSTVGAVVVVILLLQAGARPLPFPTRFRSESHGPSTRDECPGVG